MEYYYVVCNSRGDVVDLYTGSGIIKAHYTYDSWGNVISITDKNGKEITSSTHIGIVNPIRYRGYYYDAETGYYYLQSRYYNPQVGRFLNADGYISTGQGILGTNMFAYCLNNPINFTDSTGKSAFWALLCLGVIGVGMLFLSGCSQNKAPTDYRKNDTNSQNCYSYAFNLEGMKNPGDYSANGSNSTFSIDKTYTVDEISDFVMRDMNALGKSVRIVSSPQSKKANERIVAMKVVVTDSPEKFDYHFATQLSNGAWADKIGFLPSRYNKIDGTAICWEINEFKIYNSDTIYFAVEN